MKNLFLALVSFLGLFTLIQCQFSNNEGSNDSTTVAGQVAELAFLNDNAAIDQVLDSLVQNDLLPFVYARIEGKNGETLYEHSVVNQRLYPDLKVDQDTWFRVWSMSKIVTISVVMDLVEEGKLTLAEPVNKYIPEFENMQVALSKEGKPITDYAYDQYANICPLQYVPATQLMTIGDLIHHKAGFYYPWTSISCLDSIWQQYDLNSAADAQDLINRLAKMPLMQQPGSTHYYGLNTTVLGLVAERATGQSLKELVETRVTQPLKIEGLQYSQPTAVNLLPHTNAKDSLTELAPRNEKDIFGAALPDYAAEHPLYLGGEGMLATTNGYADFMRMLLQRGQLNDYRFLDEATITEISAPHTQLDNPWGHNGYNLWVTSDTLKALGTGEANLWVSGGYEGTYGWVDHRREFVGLVMTQLFNMKTGPSDLFREAVYQEIWDKETE